MEHGRSGGRGRDGRAIIDQLRSHPISQPTDSRGLQPLETRVHQVSLRAQHIPPQAQRGAEHHHHGGGGVPRSLRLGQRAVQAWRAEQVRVAGSPYPTKHLESSTYVVYVYKHSTYNLSRANIDGSRCPTSNLDHLYLIDYIEIPNVSLRSCCCC